MVTVDIGCGMRTRGDINVDVSCLFSRCDVRASAEFLPLKGKSVDRILCSQVLEHLDNPDRALQEFHGILRENGYCLIDVPTRRFANKSKELLVKFLANLPFSLHPSFIGWMIRDVRRMKSGEHGSIHKHIVTESLIQRYFTIVEREMIGYLLFCYIPVRRLRQLLRRFQRIPSGVAFYCQKAPTTISNTVA